MKRVRKYLKKLRSGDRYNEQIVESLSSVKTKTKAFAEEVRSYAIDEATKDLLERIEALENEMRAMRNGVYPKIKLH